MVPPCLVRRWHAAGSATDGECRIDAISQSWAAISGAADQDARRGPWRRSSEQLIRRKIELALLFTPPFDQNTARSRLYQGLSARHPRKRRSIHACRVWSVIAFAELGEGDKAAELFSLLNPINQPALAPMSTGTRWSPMSSPPTFTLSRPHTGRGGWTWYTGSAGWMQRAGVESILGLRLEGDILHLNPCVPKTWPRFEMTVRFHSARYEILVENPDGVCRGVVSAMIDGQTVVELPLNLKLLDDGATHDIQVRLG